MVVDGAGEGVGKVFFAEEENLIVIFHVYDFVKAFFLLNKSYIRKNVVDISNTGKHRNDRH